MQEKISEQESDQLNMEEAQKKNHEVLPKLYSKRVIYVFSVLFSTIFGTVILMSNLKQIGNSKGRLEVLVFGIIYTLGSFITLTNIEMQANFGLPLNILGGLILNEFFWNRYIGKDTEFEKKSWHKPAIISGLICLPFVLAMFYGM